MANSGDDSGMGLKNLFRSADVGDGRGNGQGDLFRRVDPVSVAKGLGWFSIGLGVAELLAPKMVARVAGLEGKNCALIRLFGLREIASGLAIFSQARHPASGVWSRVVGDAVDLGTLGLAALFPTTSKPRWAFAAANVIGVTALDAMTATELSRRHGAITNTGGIRVRKSVFVNRQPAELYNYWHDFSRLPTFMLHLQSVENVGDGRTHWIAKGPGGIDVEWDAEISNDKPNELIGWRSLPGAQVRNSGKVMFERAPGGRGTYLTVELEYFPPGGPIGAGVAMLFREEPLQQLKDDLRRFKQIVETGEVVRSDGSPKGTGQISQSPAQPMATAR